MLKQYQKCCFEAVGRGRGRWGRPMNNRWLAVFVPPVLSSLMAIDVSSFHQILPHMRARLRVQGGGRGERRLLAPRPPACLLSRSPSSRRLSGGGGTRCEVAGDDGFWGGGVCLVKRFCEISFPSPPLCSRLAKIQMRNGTGAQPGMRMCCSLKSRETCDLGCGH